MELLLKEAPHLLLLGILLFVIGYNLKNNYIIIFAAVFTGFILYFFRNPMIVNKDIINPNVIFSPCMGKITSITKKDNIYEISIYLSPLDVHVQCAPISGYLKQSNIYKGCFWTLLIFLVVSIICAISSVISG